MKRVLLRKIIILSIATLIINNIYYIPVSANWVGDSKNNWNWIEGKIKVTGWKEIDKKWYYFNEDGIMSTGWINYNEKWYNLSETGEMNIGWINDNGTCYFTNSSGEMETGTIGIDGEVYTFSDSGAMIDENNIIKEIHPVANKIIDVKDEESNEDNENDSKICIGYVCTNDNSLNVRLEATISSDIIGTVAKGSEVKIIDDEKNGFFPILIYGKKGWVKSTWISFEKPKDSINDTNCTSNLNIDTTPTDIKETYLEDDSLGKSLIRDIQPSMDNIYYYSDENVFYKVRLSPPFSSGGNLIKGNCTWYAWGRSWEMMGIKPDEAGFVGNAYEWWEANKKSRKYEYGSKPRVGSIAVWKSELPNSGGCGHVAIVEKIDNGKIYISESMWHGSIFKYREIYETNYLYGYIYLDKPNY
jgi:hypothetical protein